MAKYKDVFPTRTGKATGGANERTMLDEAGGSDGIRTRIRENADGSETMLRTHGGMPRFYTKEPKRGGEPIEYPRGLCAYPQDSQFNVSWSKPVILVWDTDTSAWRVAKYNPEQTRSATPTLPETTDLRVAYWTDQDGDTCIAVGKKLFYGRLHSGDNYSSLSLKTLSAEPAIYTTIPFIADVTIDESTNTLYLYVEQGAEESWLKQDGEGVLYHHNPSRDYGGDLGVVFYDIQLPAAVTTNAEYAMLQCAVAKRWANRGPGAWDAEPNKYYSMAKIRFPDLTVTYEESVLPTYGVLEVTHGGSSGVDDAVEDAVIMETVVGHYDTSSGGGNGSGYLSCRPTDGSGMQTDPYNPIYYIPKHNVFYIEVSPFPHAFLWKGHQFREDTFALNKNDRTKIGNVAENDDALEVFVEADIRLDALIRADGYTYRADADTVDPSLWPLYSIGFFRGDLNDESVIRALRNTTDDQIEIRVVCGDKSIVVFKHVGLGNGSARAVDRQVLSGFSIKAGNNVWFEGTEGDFDKARVFGNNDIRPCTPPLTHPYPGDPIGTEYQGYETVSSWADQYNSKYTGAWRADNSFAPYAGTASFSGEARTIVAFDMALEFWAYVEARASSALSFSSPSGSWSIGRGDAQLTTEHRVEYYFVVEYKTFTYRTTLIDEVFSKPGPWDAQTIEDWLQWPWTNSMPGTINVISAPRVFPDVSKFRHVDNVFLHQGVCLDLAGIPVGETEDLPGGEVIFAKRFKITDLGAEWLLADYRINETQSGTDAGTPYYYCPNLRPMIEDTYYQIEFDQTGLRAWLDDIPSKTTVNIAEKENRDAVCYRV